MQILVLIPGIMGSCLKDTDGELVWPPTVREVTLGYRRTDALMSTELAPDGLLRKVWCFPVYQTLIDDLHACGFDEEGERRRLLLFDYDWRLDLFETAERLAARLDELEPERVSSIYLVGHSMGGLVARLLLESERFVDRPWFPKIHDFIGLSVPHRGASLALERVLGLSGTLGISKQDAKRLAGQREFPACYQLLPAPGEVVCWDTSGERMSPVDLYSREGADALEMDGELVERARVLHASLDLMRRPAHTRYFFVPVSGHDTSVRVDLAGSRRRRIEAPESGDGTVPLWSAADSRVPQFVVTGEHVGFWSSNAFRQIFYRLLGRRLPAIPFAAGAARLRLSVREPVIREDAPVHVLLVASSNLGQVRGELRLERSDDPERRPFEPAGAPVPVRYDGPPMSHLRMVLRGIEREGFYRLVFDGNAETASPALFAIGQS